MARDKQQPWAEGPDHPDWESLAVSQKILGQHPDGRGRAIPREWAAICAKRLREGLRNPMREAWVGLCDGRVGPLTDWVIACAIARENCLLLGLPGVAKSEIATRMFQWLGLSRPAVDAAKLAHLAEDHVFDWNWWQERREAEQQEQKYFHYLLSRFSQVEELFGPVELSLLKKGIMARVNFGLLTGPGVRAAFLDETFKASSAVLNTLLTLTQERTYFNWGGMVESDLVMFIAASNEMPGGFATGTAGQGGNGEDFATLHAFLDRFPIRLEIPNASGTSSNAPKESDLAQALAKAMGREAEKFGSGNRFGASDNRVAQPCINDVLLLGRSCLQGLYGNVGKDMPTLFARDEVTRFTAWFNETAEELQKRANADANAFTSDRICWTITPRKLRSLLKVSLAIAAIRDDGFISGDHYLQGLQREGERVFDLVWDSPAARAELYGVLDSKYVRRRPEPST